jgi:hypothetical protein
MTEKYFRPWTSRVRSPSPALRINSLRGVVFSQTSVISIKEVDPWNSPPVLNTPAHIRGLIRVEVRAFCDCQPGHAGRRCFLVFPDPWPLRIQTKR